MLAIKNQIKIKLRTLKILFISITLLNFISCSRKPNLNSFLDHSDIQIGKLTLKEDSVSFTPLQTTEQEHGSPWQKYSYTVRACFEKANIEDSIEYREEDFKIINTASNKELKLKMEKENDKICLTWNEKFTYNRLVLQNQEGQTIEMKRKIIYEQNTHLIFFYFNLNNTQLLKRNEISKTLSEGIETEENYLNNLEEQRRVLDTQPQDPENPQDQPIQQNPPKLPEVIQFTYSIQQSSTPATRVPDSFCNQASQFICKKEIHIQSLSFNAEGGNYCFRIGSYYKFRNNNTFQIVESQTTEEQTPKTWQIKSIESDKITEHKEFITFQDIQITDGFIQEVTPKIIYNNQDKPYPSQDLKFFLHFTEGDCTADTFTDLNPNEVYWETEVKKNESQIILTKTSEKLSDNSDDDSDKIKIVTLEKGGNTTIEITKDFLEKNKILESIYKLESELNSSQYLLTQFLKSNKLKYIKNSAGDEAASKTVEGLLLEDSTIDDTIRIESCPNGICAKKTTEFYLTNSAGNPWIFEDINLLNLTVSNSENICTLLFDSFNDSLKGLLSQYNREFFQSELITIGRDITSQIWDGRAWNSNQDYIVTYDGECWSDDSLESCGLSIELNKTWFKRICEYQLNSLNEGDVGDFHYSTKEDLIVFNQRIPFTAEKKIILNKPINSSNSNWNSKKAIINHQMENFSLPLLETLYSYTKLNPALFSYRPLSTHEEVPEEVPFENHLPTFINQSFNNLYKELNTLFLTTFEAFNNKEPDFQFELLEHTNFKFFRLSSDQYKVCWIFKLNKFFMINILWFLLNRNVPGEAQTLIDLYKDTELFKGNGFVYCRPEEENQSQLTIEETYYTFTFNEKILNVRNTDTMKMLQLIKTIYSEADTDTDVDSFFSSLQNIQDDYNQQSLMVLDAEFTKNFLLSEEYLSEKIIDLMIKTPDDPDFFLSFPDTTTLIPIPTTVTSTDPTSCPTHDIHQSREICLLTTYRKFLSLPLPLPNSQNMFSPLQ